MPSITLTFPNSINVSAQVGDTAYYTNDVNGETIVEIGTITAINIADNSITCNIAAGTVRPTASSFILFSKDKYSNPSGLLGYYAEVCFKNNSRTEAELFGINADIFESSK